MACRLRSVGSLAPMNLQFDSIKIDFAGKTLKRFYPTLVFNIENYLFYIFIIIAYIVLSISLIYLVFRGINKKLNIKIIKPLEQLDTFFKGNIEDIHSFPKMTRNNIVELSRSFENINKNLQTYIENKDKIFEAKNKLALTDMAKQVAHDIRSPLEALRSITGKISSIDSTTKAVVGTAINRISQIANNLLEFNRNINTSEIINIRMLVEEIIYNKEHELGIKISFSNLPKYSKCFISANESELYRSISNLLNNAYDAINEQGDISVLLTSNNNLLQLVIKDTGHGMPKEVIEKALIGGYTSKAQGNGIGLSTTKDLILKMHGIFDIESTIGIGTEAKLIFRVLESPSWFADKIIISKNNIHCIYNYISLHPIYQDKLSQFNVDIKFSNGRDCDFTFIKKDDLCLIDFDLGFDRTGMDIIKTYKLQGQSYLITSLYNDKNIQEECLANNIKIIPKQIFNYINIIREKINPDKKEINVFIDDDELMHLIWKLEAQKNFINLITFTSIDEFLKSKHNIPKDCRIYIDSNLGNGLRGEIQAESLFEMGYTNLVLATGYAKSDLNIPYWIKEVVGKRPNFTSHYQ